MITVICFDRSCGFSLFSMATLNFLSLNCHGLNDSIISYLHRISGSYDVVLLQETWLSDFNSHRINKVSDDYIFFHSSAMETKLHSDILTGRPFGGTAVLVKSSLANRVQSVVTNNPRITAVLLKNDSAQDIVISSIYMPFNDRSVDQIAEYESTVGCLQALIDGHLGCKFVLGGDFNVKCNDNGLASSALLQFCEHNRLLWLEPEEGSCGYTFHNDTSMHYSLIDHFLCSPGFVNNTDCTHILVHGDNTSDHLAISVSLHLPADIKFSSTAVDSTFKFRWDRADLSYYQAVLTSSLSSLSLPIDALLCRSTEGPEQASEHARSLDNYYTDIISCLQYATKVCIPQVKVGLEKHWWTPDLEDLKKQCIDATDLWRIAGCPRSGDLNSNRVRIKLKYKNAIKEAAKAADEELNDKLVDHLCSKDNSSFWKAWRKRFCMKNIKTTAVLNGVYGDDNILKEFSSHFSKVGQSNTANADVKYESRVCEYLLSHPQHPTENDVPFIDVHTVQDCIGDLKLRKATGHDGISNEQIIYGGSQLAVHLSLLFNAMLRHSCVPNDFRLGIIKPLLKCKHGDQTSLDMYRGITLTPVLSKLFEAVLLVLYGSFLTSSSLQYGFKKNSSCNHALFTFVESMKYFTKRGSKIFCAFLDASKAFDKVLINGLLTKLIDRNVPYMFIRILHNWFSNLSCSVVWKSMMGDAFRVTCGVRQGGILSPILFSVYIDDIIEKMRKSGYGIYIGTQFVGSILYADDIALVSCSCHGLQKLIDICQHYGGVWDIKFNATKSQAITFGGNHPKCTLKLGTDSIQWVNRAKYLGCYFNAGHALSVDTSAAISKFYGSLNNILNVIGYSRNEMVAVHLATAYCLPALLYSCESWSLRHELKPMTVAWNNAFRKIFNCCWRENPRILLYYCNSLPLAYLIDQRRLLFWKRLYHSGNSLLYSLASMCYGNMTALAAKYDIYSPLASTSSFEIKLYIWKTFEKTIVN